VEREMSDDGLHSLTYIGYYDAASRPLRGVIPQEEIITLHLNGHPLVSLMCTPIQMEELAIGFLFNEGVIESIDDVAVLRPCSNAHCLDIWLEYDVESPTLRTITSGCSGGTTFNDVRQVRRPVESTVRVPHHMVPCMMQSFMQAMNLYRRAGGIHGAALANATSGHLICLVEDIGRHNALDKVAGHCLQHREPMHDRVLLTSGRVSAEMINKVARMQVPVVISRTSPTSLAVQLARAWHVTLIGYARRRSFHIYAGEERVFSEPESEATPERYGLPGQ